MKKLRLFRFSIIPVFFLTTCHFTNFYPDPDDSGLSRFTSRGYNVASGYINGKAFVNISQFNPVLSKDSTGNQVDTLLFKWALFPDDIGIESSAYKDISFLLPVPESFNKTNFLAFNGRRFLNSIPVTLQDSSLNTMTGISTLYFVSVNEVLSTNGQKYIQLSGLFDGNIGDSIFITKGRFDFEIDENTLNF